MSDGRQQPEHPAVTIAGIVSALIFGLAILFLCGFSVWVLNR